MSTLLQVRDLWVEHALQVGTAQAVCGVSLAVAPGEILGIVGESGSGKTQLLLALLGLAGPSARMRGSVQLRGEELLGAGEPRLNAVRGDRIAMIFQDPTSALNPYLTIGTQLLEVLAIHRGVRGAAARARAVQVLEAVRIADAAHRLRQYPHELSGGMRQRVMIAMALLCEPQVLLADEPTTALDVTVQAHILTLLLELRERFGTAIVLVTHDLGVVAEIADRVAVMRDGRIVEQAPVEALFDGPREPYTLQLLKAARRLELI